MNAAEALRRMERAWEAAGRPGPESEQLVLISTSHLRRRRTKSSLAPSRGITRKGAA